MMMKDGVSVMKFVKISTLRSLYDIYVDGKVVGRLVRTKKNSDRMYWTFALYNEKNELVKFHSEGWNGSSWKHRKDAEAMIAKALSI